MPKHKTISYTLLSKMTSYFRANQDSFERSFSLKELINNFKEAIPELNEYSDRTIWARLKEIGDHYDFKFVISRSRNRTAITKNAERALMYRNIKRTLKYLSLLLMDLLQKLDDPNVRIASSLLKLLELKSEQEQAYFLDRVKQELDN